MTPKQIERVHNKIKRIRKEIYEEKRLYGGYHDGRGLRYVPFELFLKIQDFKGGLTYLRWFTKTFPDDIGMPEIMFMASLIYFKNDKIKDAEKKALQTYFADSMTLNIFFDRSIKKDENSNIDLDAFNDFFSDLKKQTDLSVFQNWLADFEKSERFINVKTKYREINKRLKTEEDEETRDYLYKLLRQIQNQV